MATADELLAGVIVVDKTLIVDNDFRSIKIPSSVPNLGVEHDDDVLQLDFKMPRYISNTDLSGFSIRINYINAKGETDAYTVNKPVVGDQYITFSWLVGPTATRYKGNTSFIVCATTLNASGEIDKEFNTTIATLPVLEGLEVDESIVTEYSDIIEQWRRELFGIGDTEEASIKRVSQNEQAAIEAKGADVLATIPPEYTETYEAAQEGIRTKADAIVCSAQGETILVSDSSDDYVRGLKIFGKTTQTTTTGKNMFDPECLINAGWSKYNETYYGTSSLLTDLSPEIAFKPNTRYTISTWGHGSSSGDVSVFIYVHYTDGTMVTGIKIAADRTPKYYTYTTVEGKTVDYVRFSYGYNQKSCLWDTMIEEGVSATAYEPFSNGLVSPAPDLPRPLVNIDSTQAIVAGKNLVTNDVDRVATINNGVTFTIKKDSSEFIIGGTQDGTKDASGTLAQKILLTPGTYTVSVSGLCGSDYINVQRMNGDNGYAVTGVTQKTPKTFTIRDNTTVLIQMVVMATSTYNNTPLTVQLEAGSIATEYEPYKVKQSINMVRALSGIPVTTGGNYTDENGQQWVCDEVDFERGVYIQRVYALVSDYNSGWKISGNSTTNHNAFYRMNTELPTMIKGTNKPVVCTHFTMTRDPVADHVTCVSGGLSNQEVYFFVPKSEFPDVDTWTNYVVEQANAGTPITTYYILNEPIETPLSAEELAAFKDLHTNYPNTTVLNDAGATMELAYNADTQMYIDNLPGASDEDIANAVESYLEENPIEAVDLDTTLSKSGQAADAKAVGDAIGNIETALDGILAIQNELIGGDGV